MRYLDCYLNEVKHHLYTGDKNDIINELRSDIENRLQDNYSDADLIVVLEELGCPKDIAQSYNIGSEGIQITNRNFSNYVKVLKILFLIGLLSSGIASLQNLIDFETMQLTFTLSSFIAFIAEFISIQISFTLSAIGVLTIIFYLIEKHQGSDYDIAQVAELDLKPWTVSQLKSEDYNYKKSGDYFEYTFEALFTVIFPVIFVTILKNPVWPAEYNFFDPQYLNLITIIVFFGIAFELVVLTSKFIYGKYDLKTVLATIIGGIYGIITSYILLVQYNVFKIPSVIDDVVPFSQTNLFTMIFAIVLISSCANIIFILYKYIKTSK